MLTVIKCPFFVTTDVFYVLIVSTAIVIDNMEYLLCRIVLECFQTFVFIYSSQPPY